MGVRVPPSALLLPFFIAYFVTKFHWILDITLDKKSNTEGLLHVKLNEADYGLKVDDKLKEYSKTAQIKGFRPGKVPKGVIKKMMGTSILIDQVNELVQNEIYNYIDSNDIQVIGQPIINRDKASDINWETQKEFEFEYRMAWAADFAYDFEKEEVVKYKILPDAESIKMAVDEVRRQNGKVTNPDSSEDGDVLLGHMKLKDDEDAAEVESVLSLERVKEDKRAIYIGVKAGDVVEVDIEDTFNTPNDVSYFTGLKLDELEGLQGVYTFKVDKIHRNDLAEIDQELFDKLYGEGKVTSQEEFEEKMREKLVERLEYEMEYRFNSDLKDKIIASVDIELPEDFLKEEIFKPNAQEEDLDKVDEMMSYYASQIKWDLIKARVLKDANVEVQYEDVLAKAKELFRRQMAQYMPNMGDELEERLHAVAVNYLQEQEGKNYQNLHDQVKDDKVLVIAGEKMAVNTKEIEASAYQKMMEEQAKKS